MRRRYIIDTLYYMNHCYSIARAPDIDTRLLTAVINLGAHARTNTCSGDSLARELNVGAKPARARGA